MVEKLVAKLIEFFPQGVTIMAAVILVRWVLNAYISSRKETEDMIKTQVGAQLNSMVSQISAQSRQMQQELSSDKERATAQLQEIGKVFAAAESLSSENKALESLAAEVRGQIDALQQQIPLLKKNAKIPASTLALRAQEAKQWSEACLVVEEMAADPDAASTDLEVAGDAARRFRQYGLALEFHRKATAKDPENST